MFISFEMLKYYTCECRMKSMSINVPKLEPEWVPDQRYKLQFPFFQNLIQYPLKEQNRSPFIHL